MIKVIDLKQMNECYTKRYLKERFNKDNITADELIGLIEELIDEKENLQEQYEDLKRDLEDNYKPISVEEQIGWNERW